MLDNGVFDDNVFSFHKFNVGDEFFFLCEFYENTDERCLFPMAQYDPISKSIIRRILTDSSKPVKTIRQEANVPEYGIWKLKSIDSKRVYSYFEWNTNLYVVHTLPGEFNSKFDVIDYLQNSGISISDFEEFGQEFFVKLNFYIEPTVNSLLLKRSDFDKFESSYRLKKKLLLLNGTRLVEGSNFNTFNDAHQRKVSFYKYSQIREDEIVKVNSQSEEKICLQAITKYLDDIYKNKNKNTATKNYVNAFSDFLQDFTSQNYSILDLVSRTGLSQENLLNKIGEIKSFLENGQSTFDELLIRKVVDNNENIRKDFLSIVAKNYESELQSYKDDIQKERSILTAKQEEKSKLEQEILEIEQRKSSLIQFEDSFTRSFESKLDELKKSVPEALSSVMFNRSIIGSSIQSNREQVNYVSSCNINDSCSINENELEKIESIEELLECADYRFTFLNLKSEFRKVLIASLYTCDKFHCNLLLCGKLSEQIAQTYSFIVYGAKAAVLDCSQDYEPSILNKIESLKAKVVVVRNPFESNWIDKLASISVSSDKFIVLTHPFIEDLIIEPKSVYSYFIPLFTNELIDFSKSLESRISTEDIEIPTIVKFENDPFEEKQESSGDSPLSLSKNSELKTVLRYLPSEITNRYKLLNKKVELITNAKNSKYFISMFIVPYLFATGKIDEKNLDDIKEKEDASNYLKELLGSDND